MMPIHPIEIESYEIMRSEVDFSRFTPLAAAVIERMIHSTADLDYADSAFVPESAVDAGVAALQAGADIVVDAQMVKMGITSLASFCYLDQVANPSPDPTLTRSAMAMRIGALRHPDGAIFIIGNAPTALFELLRLVEAGDVRPALVIGLPVGFVGAAESKAMLRASSIAHASISNVGRKGGSAVAAGAMNAIARLARPEATK